MLLKFRRMTLKLLVQYLKWLLKLCNIVSEKNRNHAPLIKIHTCTGTEEDTMDNFQFNCLK